MMRQKGTTMQIIPKACRAGLVLALLVLVLMLSMLPARMTVSAIPAQPAPARAVERSATADAHMVAIPPRR
jgi:hypothetical protein